MPSDTVIVFRLILAAILGGLVGLEREINGREAGIRTYLLVSLGSALIMVLSQYLPHQTELGQAAIDPSRIAAQAITGIGFLGAGVIIRYKNSIRGLTTAACMWVTCGVGLSVGAGYYLYASIVSALTLLSLIGLKLASRRLRIDWYRDLVVVSDDLDGQFERIKKAIEDRGAKVTAYSIRKDRAVQELKLTFRVRFRAMAPFDRDVFAGTYQVPGVSSVELK